MTILESAVEHCERYSIDEASLALTGMPGDLEFFSRDLRYKILRCRSIPVGIGIAHTKALGRSEVSSSF
jgi:DNA polymerase V